MSLSTAFGVASVQETASVLRRIQRNQKYKVNCLLSAPSSLFTASTNRSWRSTVHLNLGLFADEVEVVGRDACNWASAEGWTFSFRLEDGERDETCDLPHMSLIRKQQEQASDWSSYDLFPFSILRMLNLYKQRKLEELTSKWGLSQLSVIAMPSCSDNICNSICSPWAKALLPCEASADRLRKSCTMSSGCSSSPLISPLNSRGELEDWTAEFCRLHSGGWGRKGKLLSSLHGSDPVEDEEQRLAQNADERENRGSGCSGNDTWDRGIPGSRSETDLFGDKGRPSRKLDDLISSFRMEEGLVEDKSSSDGFSQSNWRSKWTDNGEAWQECMAPSGELCCLIVIKLWLLIVLDWLKNTDREILLASNLAGKLNWWFGTIILWQTKQIPTKTKWFPLFF